MKPESPDIDLAFDLPFPPDKVWKALTTPQLLARWLGENDMVPEAGARFTLRPANGPPATCEVVEIDETRGRLRLAWVIGEETQATTVRFELAATATGTVLRIAHSGFGAVVAATDAAVQPPRLRLVRRTTTVRANPGRSRMQWAA